MPGVSNALLLASQIAFAAALAPTCVPRLPGTFSGAAPNFRSLPALNRAGNAPAALNGLTMEHSRVSRRQLCVWGAGIASALVSAPARAAPTSANDIVPATLTGESAPPPGGKIRAMEDAARTEALRVQVGGGSTQWTLLRESFLG
ncbi:hypothetical protein T484DRAFT_1958118, partial [Baffinella frigidus]